MDKELSIEEGYLINCIIEPREGQDGPCFNCTDKGIIACLEGYAVVPREKYEAMKNE